MADLESIQINLNSKFALRYINGSKCHCVFELPNIKIKNQHHIHISVANAIIPYSFYNVNSSNNILYYIINGIPSTLTILPGNYNAIQLASYFASNMVNFSCSYSSITNTFTFTNTVNDFTFSFVSSCLKTLGFYNIDTVSSNKTLTSVFCANLQSNQCIHIKSNFLTGNINSSNIYLQDTLCSIPINTAPNSNIVFFNTEDFSTNLYSNILNDIVIKIVNQDNFILDLNNLDWSITLQLDIVDFVN